MPPKEALDYPSLEELSLEKSRGHWNTGEGDGRLRAPRLCAIPLVAKISAVKSALAVRPGQRGDGVLSILVPLGEIILSDGRGGSVLTGSAMNSRETPSNAHSFIHSGIITLMIRLIKMFYQSGLRFGLRFDHRLYAAHKLEDARDLQPIIHLLSPLVVLNDSSLFQHG